MKSDSQRLTNIMVQAWSGMLFILIMMFITDLIEFGIAGDFSVLRSDPGTAGLWVLSLMVCANVLLQLVMRVMDGKNYRRMYLAASILYSLFFAIHQISHLMAGAGIDIHFFFDLTHNVLGISASLAAYKLTQLDSASQ